MTLRAAIAKTKIAAGEPAIRFGLAMIAVVWASVIQQIALQGREAREQALRDAGNFARAFEESVLRGIKQVEVNLHYLRVSAAHAPQDAWGELLRNVPHDPDITVQMALTDARGKMIGSTLDPHPKTAVDLSDREHVRVHLDGAGDELFISKPLVGRVSKRWTVQFSRPIRSPDGTLAGVVVGSLDPQHFARFYRRLDLGPASAVALVGTDGVVRAGAGAAEGMLGADVMASQLGAAFGQAAEGRLEAPLWDGTKKYTVWRRVDNFPLVVAASVDAAAVAAEQRALRSYLIIAATVLSIVIALAGILLARDRRWLEATRVRLSQSERHAREDSERLAITLENMKQGIVMADAAGRFVVRSKVAERLIGADDAVDSADVDARLAELVGPVPSAPGMRTHMLPGGTILKVVTVPLVGGGCVATFEDITELQRRHDDLVEAKAAADTANQAKSAFLANMSHELRTPMNGVMGMTEVLMETRLDPAQRKYAEAIGTSATALLVIINDMLDFSKIEAGKVTIEPKRFRLDTMIDEIVTLVSPLAAEKGLEIATSYAPDLPRAWIGDPGRIRQIVTNLVGNAVKFTPAGRITINVGVNRSGGTSTHEVAIAVSDTGIGIAADRLGHIFEEFVQLGTHSHVKHGGTGLGLAISQRLAGLMGGRIGVSSVPGDGSTFTLTLPLARASEDGAGSTALARPQTFAADPAIVEPPAAATKSRLKVLAAEDGPTNRLVLASMLKSEPIDLVFAHDGAEAVTAFAVERPSLVLMDVWMPELDGFEATARIRALETKLGLERTPIIALTANAVRGDRERCIAAGMDDYMSKPIVKKDLVRMIAHWRSHLEAGTLDGERPDWRETACRRGRDAGSMGARWSGDVPLIDEAHVAVLCAELEGGEFASLVEQFGRDVETALQALATAAGRGDKKEIRALLHLVRGSASHLGVTAIVRLCDEVRARIDSSDVDWGRCVAELGTKCAAARERLPQLAATG